MDEAPIGNRIEKLIDEEHRLRTSHAGERLDPVQQTRLQAVEAELDSCWDVLRRRRAGQPEGLSNRDVPGPANDPY